MLLVIFGSYQNIYAQTYVTVNTTLGAVKGLQTKNARVFYGGPFAKPPTGSRR